MDCIAHCHHARLPRCCAVAVQTGSAVVRFDTASIAICCNCVIGQYIVPALHAYAAHWLAPGSTRGLTLKRRQHLLCLTAASGVVANLEVAEQVAGCLLTNEVFHAAASAGQLASCQWLLGQGSPGISDSLEAAAGGGHRHVCEWLLSLNNRWRKSGEAAAARSGHVGLMEWLQEQRPQMRFKTQDPTEQAVDLVRGAAHGCDLVTMQRLWPRLEHFDNINAHRALVLAAAAGSPTPDWAAKVEWLEAQGCRLSDSRAANEAAALPDAVARLAWMRGRGVTVFGEPLLMAARTGNMAVLQYLLAEGSVELLAWLRECGCPWDESAYTGAAEGGCRVALEWLAARGCPMPADGKVYRTARRNGDLATARCLRQLGCPEVPTGPLPETRPT
ncbi:hypothetical protein GPECTOR_5g450 [Gonium pectorale]|uniref:Ankyrin repeat domain-containing protein n=1 Tax=Gonium pectorale TaxID=33097 RepID=A0A150GWY2_GONPE|nr:hypothetical protein GPECTOR_5g450 [Gonium pectorale]|eukprot:KXZ54371.1 hypothetical protein GPECTOR_5g450 [Gonium pectorale]